MKKDPPRQIWDLSDLLQNVHIFVFLIARSSPPPPRHSVTPTAKSQLCANTKYAFCILYLSHWAWFFKLAPFHMFIFQP